MDSAMYWKNRETEQRKHNIQDEAEYQKHIQEIYQNMIDEIEKEINGFYGKYARKEGITMAEAKKRAAKLDIEAYGRKAAKYVKEKNFSKQANEEMRLYNLTMKVNRLELLKAQIGLEMVSGFDELQKYYEEILTDRAVSEFERQAGILGKTIQNNAKAANAIVNASFHNATFSDRIWMYQDMLKNELSSLLQTGLIRGENPRRLATHLRKRFGVSQGNAERLMITELARVQTEAQKQSFERNGFEEYTFLALGDACPICKALDGKHFKVKKMMPGTNASPMHPRCRCSVAAYEDSEDYGDWLDFLDKGGTTEEWNELKKQRNSKEYSALKTKKEAADYLKNVLGVNSVNLKGLTVDEINEINKSLRNIYQEYPQLQFFIQKVKTSTSGGHTAAFVSKYDAGKITTEILVNPTDFKNIKKVVDRSVKAGYWTPKEGIEGVMRHETGHALEMYLTFSERGVNPFDTQPNGLVDRYQAMKASMAGEYSKKVVSKAFENLGIPLTADNIEKYVSTYAREDYEDTGRLKEVFAEIISDNRKGKLYNELKKLLPGGVR